MDGKAHLAAVLGVGIVAISFAAILIRWCDDAPPLVIAAARLGIATVLLLPLMIYAPRRRRARFVPMHVGLLVLGGSMLAAHFYFWIESLRHTSVLNSVVIVTTSPIFVGLGSYFFFAERLTRHLIFGMLMAMIGGVTISLGGADAATEDSASVYGNLLALAGGAAAGGYFLVGRRVRRDIHLLTYMVVVYGLAAIVLLLCGIGAGVQWTGYRPSTYFYFVLLAALPQLVGHGSLNYALRHVSATIVAVCVLGEPIGAGVLAFFMLGESPDGWQLVGAVLILFGIFLAVRQSPTTAASADHAEPVESVD